MSRDRELVVFLPAVGGDSTFWRPQLAALADDYATLALDLVRPAAEVSMAGFADDVAAAIEQRGYTRAHVVGLSMGGVVALELLARHRDKVRSLTLANTWAFHADAADRRAWFSEQMARMSVPEFSRMSLPGLFAPTTDRRVVEAGIAVESAKDPAMYQACWHAMLVSDHRGLLANIDVPLLLIGGALDAITPTSLLRTISDSAACARLVELPGASHFSNLDCPEAFITALRGQLRGARGHGDDRLDPAPEATFELPAGTSAEQLLRLLDHHGVQLLASNSGTDFTPIIDALARLDRASDARSARGRPRWGLRIVACPHENTVISLAHGHALLSHRPQAAMGHVGVGTAAMGMGIINARRARVPILVLAGHTPWYEQGRPGARSNFVQWGQDTFDQGGYFREFTKWDYELRSGHALDVVVERALAIAESPPAGPVYLTLPKEPLCEQNPAIELSARARQTRARASVPEPAALATAARWLREAERAVIVTADLGHYVGGPEALLRLSQVAGVGVIEHGKRNFFNFPTEHPHHLGFDPAADIESADLVIAVECPVPWIPSQSQRARAPRVIGIGVDPLFGDLPMRGFPCDLNLAGDPAATLRALADAIGGPAVIRPELAALHEQRFTAAREAARRDGTRERITKAYLSWMIGQLIDDDVVIVNEYNLDPWLVPRRCSDSWFENSVASGLGWSLGAALGAKLAAPERTIVATLGDGAYYFNAPLSAHHVAAAQRLPIVVIVFNDQAWSTIKSSTRGSHPRGDAVRDDRFALCDFNVAVDFAAVAEAAGGVGIRVEATSEVEAALRRALALARTGDRLVLLDVICERNG
ncbi:thiamine pyrophosphate-requiring protein [Nannocystis sp.]|uniref:thiamine pyrophosphate-requiring protein n=1 Tax=Nannocystis sp. TaxID=1962667 RepID=UPI0025D96372|nr:thiamine pyrophosphate-requiring protein [Nannocystis sp.]MBK7829127.1 thiamine pyrophosphate-requiring protein [Nannocystis sp.]